MSLAGNIWGDHPALAYPTEWWACDEPERPADTHVRFWHECGACRLAFTATVILATDPTVNVRIYGDAASFGLPEGQHPLNTVARAMADWFHDPRMTAALDRAGV